MSQQSDEDDSPQLSSEFEDLGIADEATPSMSSDWTEGGEVASRGGSITGVAVPVRPLALLAQSMDAAGSALHQEAAASSSTGRVGGKVPGEPNDKVYSTLKEIEDAGHKLADFTKHAASDLTKKVFGGGDAAGGSGQEESFSIKGIAEGVSSWWSGLDPGQLVTDAGSSSSGAASRVQAKTDAQQLFGLPATEELMEKFRCTLVQTYTCSHNAFTGPREVSNSLFSVLGAASPFGKSIGSALANGVIRKSSLSSILEPGVLHSGQVSWRGMLYITDRHSCWKADADDTTLMLPHGDVASVENTTKGGKVSLQVAFGDDSEFLVLRGFTAEENLEGALALLEHVTGSS